MLSKKNNDKNKAHRALALIILSLSVVSLITTIDAPNYSSAQVSDSQNTTTVGGVSSTTSTNANSTTNPTTTAGVRTLIEQTRMAVQNNDMEGALMNLSSALGALEGVNEGEQNNDMIITSNAITDGTTATEAGTIGSGGAGGAGTAGGIMTGGGT